MKKDFIKEFKNNGICVIPKFLNAQTIELVRKKLNQLEKNQKSGLGLHEPANRKAIIHSLHKDKYINSIVRKDKFDYYIKKILNMKDKGNEDYVVWNAKCNIKREYMGTVEYFHQDFAYWKPLGFKSDNMLAAMLCIDDHSAENSGLAYFEGSHKKNYKHLSIFNINSMHKNTLDLTTLTKLSKLHKQKIINCKAGALVIFHCKLVHGSSHNISNKSRRIILYQICLKNNFNPEDFGKKAKKFTYSRRRFELKELKRRATNIA